MEVGEMIYIASCAIDKNIDYETLKYSDYLYGREEFVDDIWEYVIEYEDEGKNAFKKTYSEYKMYF